MHSDKGIPVVILSCEATCGFNSYKKVKKKVDAKISLIRDQRAKKQVNKGTAKSCETREVS